MPARCPQRSPRRAWRARSRSSRCSSTRRTKPSPTCTRPRSRSRTRCPRCRSASSSRGRGRRDDRRPDRRPGVVPVVPLAAGVVLRPALRRPARGLAARGRHYGGARHLRRACAFRSGLVVAWIAGFVAYQWLSPLGPEWWVDLVERASPPDWRIGSTLPSFALAFVLGGAASFLDRRARTASATA